MALHFSVDFIFKYCFMSSKVHITDIINTMMLQSTYSSSVTCMQNWELLGVLSVTSKTFWMLKALEKRTKCGADLMKQVLVMMSKMPPYKINGMPNCKTVLLLNMLFFSLVQAHEKFSLEKRVPLNVAAYCDSTFVISRGLCCTLRFLFFFLF